MRAPFAGAALVAAVLIAPVARTAASTPPAPRPASAHPANPLPWSQSCLGSPADIRGAHIAWDRLRNPILAYSGSAIRDIALRVRGARWTLAMTSAVGSAPTFRLAQTTSPDLSVFAPPTTATMTRTGAFGAVSPDITQRADGTYVETYDGIPRAAGPSGQDKLFYRTSRDLTHWSAPHRLMPGLFAKPGDRLIDAALAWTSHGLVLGYKYGLPDNGAQHFSIAWSPSGSLAGPWTYVGQPDIKVYGDTIENYELLRIDGVWHVLGTSNQLDRPWLFRLDGDPGDPHSWLHWSHGRELEVPLESWNRAVGVPGVTFDQENSAYLCDARRLDGYFYLLYIGATELSTYGGFGHTELGIARSKDLVVWSVPCGRDGVSTPIGCA